MSDFEEYVLGEHIESLSGFPFSSEMFSIEDGMPLIRIRDVTDNETPDVFYQGEYSDLYLVENDDILIGMDGDFHIVRWKGGEGVLNQRVLKIFEKPNSELDMNFVFYWLADFLPKLNAITAATTVKHLSVKDIANAVVKAPSKVAQTKIGKILLTIDNQIDATQALIDKYTAIKQGMMADLFSRGIDPETNALRPTFEEAPELYNKTPLGMLPKGWKVIELENLLDEVTSPMRSGPFGSALLKEELVSEGIPLLGIDNIFVERFKASYKRFVTERKFRELSRYAVRERDVVITIMGTVGRSCVIPESIGLALSSKHLWTMTFDKEQILPELVCWQLNHSPWAESWFRRESQGGVMDAIQSQTLKKLKLVVPSPVEQNAIYERYENLNNHIEVNQTSLDKLKLQKTGLMQDLLTGKVPVPA
ncbi:TPA: restriction endonuclease subunit S [Vibrio cholerae]|nr:restriction endonuclease subunit S [Vibrio cholerae]